MAPSIDEPAVDGVSAHANEHLVGQDGSRSTVFDGTKTENGTNGINGTNGTSNGTNGGQYDS